MARARARFTEADLKRAMRAAEAVGPNWTAVADPDGVIRIEAISPEDGATGPATAKCRVYFVACGPFVKIGITTTSMQKRLDGMRTGNPFPMHTCLLLDGDRNEERQFHRKFNEDHHQYEWFHMSDAIKAFIIESGGTLP